MVSPVLSNLSFQYLDTGVVLNSDPSSYGQTFVDIDKVTGMDTAPYRVSQHDHEGGDGGYTDAEFEGQRTIVLDGIAYGTVTTIHSYLDTLKGNFAPQKEPMPFYFKQPGLDQRVIFCKSLGMKYNWDQAIRTGVTDIQIQLVAEDPTIYTDTVLSYSVGLPPSTAPGRGYNKSYNFGYGGSITPNAAVVVNPGNKPTGALLSIVGPVVNPVVYSDTTGQALYFTLTLLAGETLVVDTGKRTVLKNGGNYRRSLNDPAGWFLLQPGSNVIRYTAEAYTASTVNISFRPAWR